MTFTVPMAINRSNKMTEKMVYRFALKQFRPLFCRCFKEQAAEKLCIVSEKMMYMLIKKFPDVRKDIRMAVYPVGAVYLALQKIISKEKARKIMISYAPVIGEKIRRIVLFVTGFPGVSQLMWNNIESIMKRSGSEKKGYKSRIYGKKGRTAAMDILRCPVHDAFVQLGMGEITAVICAMDLIYSTGYKGIGFKRTMSVANGDPCCDYRYTKLN